MIRAVFLDSGPLGIITNPRRTPEVNACVNWLAALQAAGIAVCLPEIIDYEIRRELLRAGKTAGIARLDAIGANLAYFPLTTPAVLHAAALWARARQGGYPTAGNDALDVDVLLAAQALTSGLPETEIVVATSNVGHLSRFVPADLWHNIAVTP